MPLWYRFCGLLSLRVSKWANLIACLPTKDYIINMCNYSYTIKWPRMFKSIRCWLFITHVGMPHCRMVSVFTMAIHRKRIIDCKIIVTLSTNIFWMMTTILRVFYSIFYIFALDALDDRRKIRLLEMCLLIKKKHIQKCRILKIWNCTKWKLAKQDQIDISIISSHFEMVEEIQEKHQSKFIILQLFRLVSSKWPSAQKEMHQSKIMLQLFSMVLEMVKDTGNASIKVYKDFTFLLVLWRLGRSREYDKELTSCNQSPTQVTYLTQYLCKTTSQTLLFHHSSLQNISYIVILYPSNTSHRKHLYLASKNMQWQQYSSKKSRLFKRLWRRVM